MLEKWLNEARNDRPVWLPDVREACRLDPEAARIVLRLELWDGRVRDWPVPVPRWRDEDGRRFVGEYLRASVFNALAACSGQRLTVYYDRADGAMDGLVRALPETFQLAAERRTGCGKAVNVADRVGRAFGKAPFALAFADLADWTPQEDTPESGPRPALGEKLRRTARRAERGLYCGVDVGGTDIKLALARDGALALVREFDWDPSASPTAQGIIGPILALVRQAVDSAAPGQLLDGLGVSFPDVVIRDRIVGGETPKTRGMRENPDLDYETAFAQLTDLRGALAPLCRAGAPIRIVNDGSMAAFTAAMELAHSGRDEAIARGVVAHSLGTDLGTGWLAPDGTVPELPLELYDFLMDLGSWPGRALPAEDLRSVLNENSGLPGARRYLGQAAAFRLAQGLEPSLLDGFIVRQGGTLAISAAPDMRKPCLAHLTQAARDGNGAAREVFRRIGVHLGQISREMAWLLGPETDTRFLFGRFTKEPVCFDLIRAGCASAAPDVRLEAADENMAFTPLMAELARRRDATVAQFGQAVGAVYYALAED